MFIVLLLFLYLLMILNHLTMKEQIKHTEQKLQFLKHACINCHPSMKAYYQGQYAELLKHLQFLKKN